MFLCLYIWNSRLSKTFIADQVPCNRANALYFVVKPIDSAPSGQIDKPSSESALGSSG